MEEERKDIQELLDIEESKTEETDTEAVPLREASRRPARNGKRGPEPRSQTTQDLALMDLVAQVENDNTREYIETRAIPEMKYYSRKSKECKQVYLRCMTASIILGGLIPVVAVFSDGNVWLRVLTALLGSSVTAINAYLSLQNSKDLWLMYRSVRESLLRTLYYYFNGADIFKDGTQEEKDARLIEFCETELANERMSWRPLWDKSSTMDQSE